MYGAVVERLSPESRGAFTQMNARRTPLSALYACAIFRVNSGFFPVPSRMGGSVDSAVNPYREPELPARPK
jgi:hypothetical protein